MRNPLWFSMLFFVLVRFVTTAGADGVFFDSRGRKITIRTPVQRIIALGNYRLEAVKVLGASDKVVGIDANSRQISAYYFKNAIHAGFPERPLPGKSHFCISSPGKSHTGLQKSSTVMKQV